MTTKIRYIMTPTITVSKELDYTKALSIMIRNKTDSLIVVDNNKYIGTVNEKKFLNIGYGFDKEMYDLNIEHFLEKNQNTIEHNASIEESIQLMVSKKISKLAVLQKGVVIGEVNLFGIQKTINNFSKFISRKEESKILKVNDIMVTTYFSIDKNENVDNARKLMLKHKVNQIIVTANQLPVGIFTLRDYIQGLSKYEKNLGKNTVESLMSSPINKISPNLNIFEANEHMLNKEYKNYPVSYDKSIKGILTQTNLINAIIEYLKDNT